MPIYRQGDIAIISVSKQPAGLEPVPRDARGCVIGEGETSTHYHAVRTPKRLAQPAQLYRFTDARYTDRVLVTTVPGVVRAIGAETGNGCPRHAPIALPAGVYRVRVQVRNDSGSVAVVRD